MGPPIPLTAHSLFDNYLMVQGFVEGAVVNERVARSQLLELVRLDHAAHAACVATITDDSDAARKRASAALAALADYAAGMSIAPAQLDPGKVSRTGAP
jgi:hypothetical protein